MSFEPTGVYSRIPYRTLPDGSVEAMFSGGMVTFLDLDQFKASLSKPSEAPPPPPNNLGRIFLIVGGVTFAFFFLLFIAVPHRTLMEKIESECRTTFPYDEDGYTNCRLNLMTRYLLDAKKEQSDRMYNAIK
jgi:hypothetical protein